VIRVFPRRTDATPIDSKVYFDGPPLEYINDPEGVCVSCTFTWDKPRAEQLAGLWRQQGYNVKIGGPAYNDSGLEFVPGRFLKTGYVFTSRGCNNKCWFCYVPKREGKIRELPIVDGWRVLDSNLLQCSVPHICRVFKMLRRQPIPVSFLGGLEARLLKNWHVDMLRSIDLCRCYFAYDTEDDYEPLVNAAHKIFQNGFKPSSHIFCCYVLIGYDGDTIEKATERLCRVMNLGLVPFAMLYRNDYGYRDPDWIKFQSHWANPVKIYGTKKKDQSPTLFGATIL
jgi:hypothetical protein